jgi:hypothetical protein
MRKHSKKAHAAAVYQPSDFVSVVAIGITAIVLVLSLFAMERFAGVPVSVRGEAVYPEQQPAKKRAVRAAKPSQTSKRAAVRQARTPKPASSSSSATAATPAAIPVCTNEMCSNLLSYFLEGNPDCMKSQQCVDVVTKAIAEPGCSQDSTCYNLYITYSFYYLNQYCIQDFNEGCKKSVKDILEPHRKNTKSQGR